VVRGGKESYDKLHTGWKPKKAQKRINDYRVSMKIDLIEDAYRL
jgi:hypothetical protein